MGGFISHWHDNTTERKTQMNWSHIVRSEVKNKDRRVATNTPNLFFKLRKSQINCVSGKTYISTKRKRKSNGQALESNEIVSVENMEKMVTLDQGMQIFSDFRLTTAIKKDR